MTSRMMAALACATLALGAAPALAQTPAPAPAPTTSPPPRNDYADPKAWLCKPGRQDACSVNEDSTIVNADGTTAADPYTPAVDPKIDCFYVYPTVSREKTANADMTANPEELSVIKQQFARFGSVCRTYAPLYRQVTLTALFARMTGHPIASDPALAYHDVKDAWDYYLAHDNHGRGVVLIGHSQGSGVLIQLVKNEIDGKPIQSKIISVILGGARLQVPTGKVVGGDFKSIPLCQGPEQTGCAINFASFRETSPPPSDSLFGVSSAPGLEAACVNPAALAGGKGELHAYLASGAESIAAADTPPPHDWTNPPVAIKTPFVEAPGLLTAECAKTADGKTYLSIGINPNPSGKRTTVLLGDVVVGGVVQKNWGLHLIDMNLAMGNLIDDVRTEGAAYLRSTR